MKLETDAKHESMNKASGRASDVLIECLENQITSGYLKHNSPLPTERKLMEEFNASRTVVREAIIKLTNRGLLKSKPRYRPIVKRPDISTVFTAVDGIVNHLLNDRGGVKNLFESRIFIERALVRNAAVSAQKKDIADLKNALEKNKDSIDSSTEFYQTDIAFHGVLYGITGNPIFPEIHNGYTSWLSPHWQKMHRSPERNIVNYKAHEAIFLAIQERDPDAAEEALTNHLRAAWEFVRVTFEEDQQ